MNPGSVLFPNPSDSFYQDGEAQRIYNLAIDGTRDNYDWSKIMVAIEPTGSGGSPWLVPIIGQGVTFASGPTVPIPSAVWLLGSGLLGLVGVARKKHKAPH